MTGQSPEVRQAIRALGQSLGPDVLQAVGALYRDEQHGLAASQPITLADVAYGEHPRQRLDLYAPAGVDLGGGVAAPILLWVHGGGFLRGDKQADGLFNAHVGRLAARAGFLGVVINYRLAPEHRWPSGGEDVASALDWLRDNASGHGGDPGRIVLGGTSAGAVHVSTYLQRNPGNERVSGAVLLSGLYGLTDPDERDRLYFGSDPAHDPDHASIAALTATDVPLFVGCAEYDPARFQTEFLGLMERRRAANGTMPRGAIAIGHNHYSAAMHLGGRDDRLTTEIIAFVRECAGV